MNLNELLEAARKLGNEHGEGAASWYFDSNTSCETYERVLKGLEDGDPAVLDTLPTNPLSGKYADDLTPRSLLMQLGEDEDTVSAETQDAICTEYELAFDSAVQDRVGAIAHDNAPSTNYGCW
jgi:hypothetical protein